MKKYGDKELDKMVEEVWRKRHGYVPDYIDTWAKLGPESLKGWVKIRSAVYGGGLLPKKTKELIIVAIEAAIRNQSGLDIHMKRALDAGATKEEVFEAVMLSFMFATGVGAPQLATEGLKEDKK